MAKTKISEFDSTPANNTDINGINIAEGCAPSGINNALRQMMANLKDMNIGSTITMLNTTEEDSDGGRANKIIFKGEQSGGEESVLGEIQASHDGTADDQAGDLIFRTNDGSDGTSPTEAMRIDANQNVGIGISPFANSLGKSLDIVNGVGIFGSGNNSFFSTNAHFDSAWKYKATDEAAFLGLESGSFRFNTAASGTAGTAITFTERMRITDDGDVGIGTNSPVSNSNYATLTISDTTGGQTHYKSTGGSVTAYIGADSSSSGVGYLATETNHPLLFRTNNTERMRIDSSGNVLVGKTSVDDNVAGLTFTSTKYLSVVRSGAAPLYFNRLTNDGDIIEFAKDGTKLGSIGVSGQGKLYIGTNDIGLTFQDTSGVKTIHPFNTSTLGGSDGLTRWKSRVTLPEFILV